MMNNSTEIRIETTTLSDGSKVYAVEITDSDGAVVTLDCVDIQHAEQMKADIIATIQRNAV